MQLRPGTMFMADDDDTMGVRGQPMLMRSPVDDWDAWAVGPVINPIRVWRKRSAPPQLDTLAVAQLLPGI